MRLLKKQLSFYYLFGDVLDIVLVPVLDELELIFLIVSDDILEQNIKEKYFKLCGYFFRRFGVDLYKDLNILLKRDEFILKVVVVFRKLVYLVQLDTSFLNKTFHKQHKRLFTV